MDIFAETWESNDVCRDSNETFGGLAKEDKIYSGYYLTGIVVICVICFIGNGLIIHAILYYSYLRQVHNWFVLSLAVSDVIQGVTIPFYTLGHPSNVVILPGLRKSTCTCSCVRVIHFGCIMRYIYTRGFYNVATSLRVLSDFRNNLIKRYASC